ncbi:MAG: zinc ribbon domain-containing protein [Candidatus Hydrothermarchaeales archaeon]
MKLEKLLSIPAVVIGIGLLYVGYFEIDVVYLFFYFFLGLTILLLGLLILFGYGTAPAKSLKTDDAKGKENEKEKNVEGEIAKVQEHCPNCGAAILSAGKFCGTCGEPLN